MEELFNKITSNGCREMTEARFNEALTEYRQSIIKLVDDMIEGIIGFDSPIDMWDKGYDNGYKKALTELKQKIEAL